MPRRKSLETIDALIEQKRSTIERLKARQEKPVFVKLLFQKFPKKIVINYPAPGTSSRTLGYLCTKADQLIVPETCYHARTVQGGIPMTVTIADRLAFVRGVLF